MVSDKWLFFINKFYFFINIQFVIALNSMFNKEKQNIELFLLESNLKSSLKLASKYEFKESFGQGLIDIL